MSISPPYSQSEKDLQTLGDGQEKAEASLDMDAEQKLFCKTALKQIGIMSFQKGML